MPNKPKAWWALYDALKDIVSGQEQAVDAADALYIAIAKYLKKGY